MARLFGGAALALVFFLAPLAGAWSAEGKLVSTTDTASQTLIGVIILSVFTVLALDKAHRVLVVLGAVGLIFALTYLTPIKLISFENAHAAIDLNVIFLLASMMALVGVLKTTNVFAWAVAQLLRHARGNPTVVGRLIIWFTAILSAFLDNVTTVIFAFPMATRMAKLLKINGAAFFLPMVMAANIGGTATLIGDPPNILIGSGAGLPFMAFIYNLTAPILVMMVALVWFSERYYVNDIGRKSVARADAGSAGDDAIDTTLHNVPLLRGTAVVTGFIFVGFATHTLTGMPAAVPAVIGVSLILILQDYFYLRAHKPTHSERQHGILHIIEKEIEWPTLAFFIFLFIAVGAAVETGLIDSVARGLLLLIHSLQSAFGLSPTGTLLLAALVILWVSGFASALIDNIPYTAVSIPIIAKMTTDLPGETQVLWWALALGACLGGNGTLIGASANVTVVGLAEKEGRRISFGEFTRFGAPVTAITLAISTVYLAGWVFIGAVPATIASLAVFALLFAAQMILARPRQAGRATA